MSDILPVNQSVNAKVNVNQGTIRPDQQTAQNNFNIVDLAKVLKPNNRDDYSDNSFLEKQRQMLTEKFFFNLIKEPGLAASSLKNIFNSYLVLALQNGENAANLDEISSLVKAMTLDYSQMLNELFTQAEGMSVFKGQFFDVLRLLYNSSSDVDFKNSIVKLLKGISISTSNSNVLQSLKSNIQSIINMLPESSVHYQNMKDIIHMLEEFQENSNLSPAEQNLMNKLTQDSEDISKILEQLKSQKNGDFQGMDEFKALHNKLNSPKNILSEQFSQTLLKNLEMIKSSFAEAMQKLQLSPFANSETEKFSALALYNLSFLNSTPSNIDDLFASVLAKLTSNRNVAELLVSSYEKFNEDTMAFQAKNSDLLDSISKFISTYYTSSQANTIANSEINNILRSLIAAPNSFTPLLHFMLPMKYETAQGFGELWVDPYEIAKDKKGKDLEDRALHIFFVADIMDIGYFEVEIYLLNNNLNVNIMCPPDHINSFKSMKDRMAKAISSTTSYSFEGFNIEKLERKRSLPQVFTKLSEKRDGFNVSV